MSDFIETLNSLPDDVEYIDVSRKNLTVLPDLSRFYQLVEFVCDDNQLTELPILPITLRRLRCNGNLLTQLPKLNPELILLDCYNNRLTDLPELMCSSLRWLNCSYNQLTELPELNPELVLLDCFDNQLESLPVLKHSSLRWLDCSNNHLKKLPELNERLYEIVCINNMLTDLPVLNNDLFTLICDRNQIGRLPRLNQNLCHLSCRYNLLTCLPELNVDSHFELSFDNNPIFEVLNNGMAFDNDDANSIQVARTKMAVQKINRFRKFYYHLKYKKNAFRRSLLRARQRKIKEKYSPENISKMLNGIDLSNEDEFDRFETLLDEMDEM